MMPPESHDRRPDVRASRIGRSGLPWLAFVVSLLIALTGCGEGADRPASVADHEVVTVAAAGDIACDPGSGSYGDGDGAGTSGSCRMLATSDRVLAIGPDAVLTLGDNQYERGTLAAYQESYDQSWGRFADITYPVAGNHEYYTWGAAGYYAYFGSRAGDPSEGWYAFDLGAWHIVALNSNCDAIGGCDAGSPQESWLRDDLAASSASCTLAYMHHPRFSSAVHGDTSRVRPLWQALYDHGAELALAGHDHTYERFAAMTPAGDADPSSGIRSFVVGSGGRSHYDIGTPRANSEHQDDQHFGVLKLELEPGGYRWTFVDETGATLDAGSGDCHD